MPVFSESLASEKTGLELRKQACFTEVTYRTTTLPLLFCAFDVKLLVATKWNASSLEKYRSRLVKWSQVQLLSIRTFSLRISQYMSRDLNLYMVDGNSFAPY